MPLLDFFRRKPKDPPPHDPPPISTEEDKANRIASLLSGQGAYLAMKLCGVDYVPKEFMIKVFPFTRQEILDHLAQHNLPIETFAKVHWIDLTERDGKAIVTQFDERTGPWDQEFPNLEAAREFLRNYCLSHTYTGIDFK